MEHIKSSALMFPNQYSIYIEISIKNIVEMT